MRVSLSASGTRDQARNTVGQQAKNAGADGQGGNTADWPVLSAVRDRITAELDELAGPEDEVSITATVTIDISVTKATPAAGSTEGQ